MQRLTEAVKHIIIVNVIFFIATYFVFNSNLFVEYFSLHSTESPLFKPWQLVTYMFMHGDFRHIAFNMFSLWMFGSLLESLWGTRKFVAFYFLTGIGSAILYLLIKYVQIQYHIGDFSSQEIDLILTQGAELITENKNYVDTRIGGLNALINGQMLGASGAIAGLLMAFGMLFPNFEIMLLFFPTPIKAKHFIPVLIIYELYMEFANFSWDNVAHIGHLSGMVIGYILIKYWNKKV